MISAQDYVTRKNAHTVTLVKINNELQAEITNYDPLTGDSSTLTDTIPTTSYLESRKVDLQNEMDAIDALITDKNAVSL